MASVLMTVDELRQLKNKAVIFCAFGGRTECKWLYRNKSHVYFNDVLKTANGLMKAYIKDKSGDQRSPINGKLDGLFFMATHECGEPLSSSAFGPVRLLIPANDLLARCPNVYFTDFYCMQSPNRHYVTLVVTSPNSPADIFCRGNLLALDMHNELDNPFLFYHDGRLHVSAKSQFYVEVFYTDDIQVFRPVDAGETEANIFDPSLLVPYGSQMTIVPTFGRGSSRPDGLRKNIYCPKCNIQPANEEPDTYLTKLVFR